VLVIVLVFVLVLVLSLTLAPPDYGELLFTPSVGPLEKQWPDKASAFNRSSAVFAPDQINVTLQSYCTGRQDAGRCLTATVTATEHAAVIRLRFPPFDKSSGWDQTRHLRLLVGRSGAGLTDAVNVSSEANTVSGYTRANSGGVPIELRELREDELERLGRWSDGQSHFSHAMQLQEQFSFRNVSLPGGADPARACAELCGADAARLDGRCLAFSVELLRARGKADVCRLKSEARLLADGTGSTATSSSGGGPTIAGWLEGHSPRVPSPLFAHHFFARVVGGKIANSTLDPAVEDKMYSLGLEAVLSFDTSVTELELQVGTSFISQKQAQLNLQTEIPQPTSLAPKMAFEDVRSGTRKAWNELLQKTQLVDAGNITAADGEAARGTWYTNLYRSSVYPRMLFEDDSEGDPIHWSPYTGKTTPGVLSSDSGFWDAYRTTYPLGTVIRTAQTEIQLEGWMNAYKESGHIPGWASPGDRGAMTGNMQDAVFADALVKGIGGFDKDLAYLAIMEDAFNASATKRKGYSTRKGLKEYMQLGYLPMGQGIGDEVSATLNYALADAAMSLAAKKRGDAAAAETLRKRSSEAWRALFDAEFKGGFMRPKFANGSFVAAATFDEFAWEGASGEYTEASAWQYRFYAPHAAGELAAAYAAAPGGSGMCKYLADTFTGGGADGPGKMFHNGHWGLHHEQTEMVENCVGQYEHNNQPVWHIPYMFAQADCAAEGQLWLRQAMAKFYGPAYYSGDEDNGSMSAWFLLSAMGFYQLAPGNTSYSLGSPLYAYLSLQLDNGKLLTISAPNNTAKTPYVRSATFGGKALPTLAVEYAQLMGGGELAFSMSDTPCSGAWPC